MRLWLACALFAAGCGVTTIDLDEKVPQQTVQGSPIPNPLPGFFQFPLNLEIKNDIKAMSTGTASSVKLESLELHIDGNGDFSFVQSITVNVQSTQSGSTLPTVKVADIMNPGAVTSMDFHIEPDVELIDYVNEGVELTTQASGSQPAENVTFEGTATFAVNII